MIFRPPFVHAGSITKAQVLKLPKHLEVEVAPAGKVPNKVIAAAAENPSRQRPGRVRGSAAKENAWYQRPQAFLAKPLERRLNQRLLRGYLAARQPGENFRAFANRHSISDLAALLSGAPECAPDCGRRARNAAGTAAVQNPGGSIP